MDCKTGAADAAPVCLKFWVNLQGDQPIASRLS